MLTPFIDDLQAYHDNHLMRKRYEVDERTSSDISLNHVPHLNFASNDYLGLTTHPMLKEIFLAAIKRYGIGSGSSQMVSGFFSAHAQLEQAIAEFTGREAALLFSSGYMANIAVISSLAKEKDLLLIDRLAHASIIDAARLARSKMHRYLHNDMQSLASHLEKRNAEKTFIVTEGVFSMEGDIAPLPELVALAQQHSAYLMVDDAHGLGVLGINGRGTLSHFNATQNDVPILVATFGKACGSQGAFVAGSKAIIDNVMQFSRASICTTAMPPALAVVNKAALNLIQTEDLQQQLNEVIDYFITCAQQLDLPLLPSQTSIQALMIGSSEIAIKIHEELLANNILVGMMRPPTVPPKTSRLRISMTVNHTKTNIERLTETLALLCRKFQL